MVPFFGRTTSPKVTLYGGIRWGIFVWPTNILFSNPLLFRSFSDSWQPQSPARMPGCAKKLVSPPCGSLCGSSVGVGGPFPGSGLLGVACCTAGGGLAVGSSWNPMSISFGSISSSESWAKVLDAKTSFHDRLNALPRL